MAQSRREPVIINETQSPATSWHARTGFSRARCARAPGAPSACSRCFARDRGGLRRARCAPRRDPRAQGGRHHREQLRSLERSVHAPRLRAARARRGRASAKASQRLERALHRRRPAARHQRQLRHARRRCGARAARRARAPAPAARRLRRAHLRRPLRGAAADRSSTMRSASPNPCARAPSGSARCSGDPRAGLRSASAWRRSMPRPRSSCIRSRPPKPPARRPRIAAATASRSTSSQRSSIVRRFADINIAGQLREAIAAGRLRLDAQLILPFAGAESARPHYELLLRMIDEDGKTVGPGPLPLRRQRYQLMPHIDRWVVNQVDRGAQAARGRARRQGARVRHQLLRPVAQRRGLRRLPARARRHAAASIRSCSASRLTENATIAESRARGEH